MHLVTLDITTALNNGYLALAIVLQLYVLSGLMIRWSSHPCQLLGIFVVFKNSLSFCEVTSFLRVFIFSLFRLLDLNECGSGSNDCHVNATCYNQPGSYYCQCKEGFVGPHCESTKLQFKHSFYIFSRQSIWRFLNMVNVRVLFRYVIIRKGFLPHYVRRDCSTNYLRSIGYQQFFSIDSC